MKKIILALSMALFTFSLSAQDDTCGGCCKGKQGYLVFKNIHIEERALTAGDTDKDGKLTPEEASLITTLYLSSSRSDLFVVGDYSDLTLLPNLQTLSLGYTLLDTVDLSGNKALKQIIVDDSRVKTIILAKGCLAEVRPFEVWDGADGTIANPIEVIYK